MLLIHNLGDLKRRTGTRLSTLPKSIFGVEQKTVNFVRTWSRLLDCQGQVYESGIPSRAGVLRRTFSVDVVDNCSGPLVDAWLADHNPNKLEPSEKCFGVRLRLQDPLALELKFRFRIMLICSIVLFGKARDTVTALLFALNFRAKSQGRRVFLWNPYTLLQLAIGEVLPVEGVFHLEASYPPIRNVTTAYGNPLALEILGYPDAQRQVRYQEHRFSRSEPLLVIYLSQLAWLNEAPSERSLLLLARCAESRLEQRVEIFLHYSDRDSVFQSPSDFPELVGLEHLIRFDDSLRNLSTRQVSVSALSSIGLDLLASEVNHLVLIGDKNVSEGAPNSWRNRELVRARDDVLKIGDGPDVWMDELKKRFATATL